MTGAAATACNTARTLPTAEKHAACDATKRSILLALLPPPSAEPSAHATAGWRRMSKHNACHPDNTTLEEFDRCQRGMRIGPLDAIADFLEKEQAGVWHKDKKREYLMYSQHADGWLKRMK